MSLDEQMSFDLPLLAEPDYLPEQTIQERYSLWISSNPWVIPTLASLLDDWSGHGGRRVGVKSAVEWLRWHYTRSTEGSAWKFDNTYSSRLARDLIARYPHLDAVIETRKLRAA